MTRAVLAVIPAAAVLIAPAAAAPAANAAAGAQARAAASCVPTGLKLSRPAGKTTAKLRWKAPKGPHRGVRYRVSRDGKTVGQTRRTSARVRVSLDTRHRFAVRVISAAGRKTRCVTAKKIRVPYRAPGTPTQLATSDASGPTVTLSWRASRRGDATVGAYRVLRDGATYKQVRGTSIAIPISSNRSLSFQVQAVDSRGRLSGLSSPVQLSTGHQAPPAPASVHAAEVTEDAVLLTWAASIPARGRVTGYRVFRDGVAVGQAAGTSMRVGRLYASRDYAFTVQAVDSLGHASPPSGTLRVRTTDPTASRGRAHAFVLASTDASFADFRANYKRIGTVYPTSYDCNVSTAQLEGRHHESLTRWAQARKVAVLPRFNCQRGAILHRILTEPALRTAWLDGITSLVASNGYDGAQVDFEAGYAEDRDLYTQFVRELAARLHASGKRLSVAVSAKKADVPDHPRSTFYDYVQLGQIADHVFVMAWGIHWATSEPGPQDDLPWVRQVADYVASMPNKERFVMGMHLYAMDWPKPRNAGEEADAYEYDHTMELVQRLGVTPRLDPTLDALTFTYTGADGRAREVWYTDASTQATRIGIASERGLGIGVWRLGREDQRLWDDPRLAG